MPKYYKRKPYTPRRRRSKKLRRGVRTVGGPNLRRRSYRTYTSKTGFQNVAGMLNAFSVFKPRYMDGATPSSQTLNVRHTRIVDVAAGTTLLMLLQPDIISPLVYCESGDSYCHSVNRGGNDFAWNTSTLSPGLADPPGWIGKYGEIDRWRLVSQALRIQNLNATDANDGYVRAVRTSSTPGCFSMYLQNLGVISVAGVVPGAGHLQGMLTYIADLQQDRSYMSSASKDIGRYQFNLNPIGSDHPFKHVHNQYEWEKISGYENDAGPGLTLHQKWFPKGSTPTEMDSIQDVWKAEYDTTFDTIFIALTPGAGGTKFMFDVAANYEVTYEHGSVLAKFHSDTITDKKLQDKTDTVRSETNVSAGTKSGKFF